MNNESYNYDFEEWEGDYQLIQEEDWAGLVELRKQKAEKYPYDIYNQCRYGEALVLNHDFEKALALLTPIYKNNPEHGDVIHSILDALYGLGKTENDFDWIEEPIVLKLNDKTKNICINLLKNKRKPIPFLNIVEHFTLQSYYLTFKENDLYIYLMADISFEFSGDKSVFWDVDVKLKKK